LIFTLLAVLGTAAARTVTFKAACDECEQYHPPPASHQDAWSRDFDGNCTALRASSSRQIQCQAEDPPFFSKSSGYEHDVVRRTANGPSLSEVTLTEIGRVHGFDVISTKDGGVFDGNLAQLDAFFFFTTGNLTEAGTDSAPPMSAQGKEALLAAIRDGKGFLGVHSASDTFHSKGRRFETQQQPDPYIAMLGGEFLAHGSQQEARVRVVDANFPGLRSLSEDFTLKEEWYSLKNFRQDNHVLLILETAGMHDPDYKRPPFPIAWARTEGKGRVYYNAMGHREDI
jgi:uncharacterized protein